MRVHCSTPGCEGVTGRLNGKCSTCKATAVVPAVLEVAQVQVSPPAPARAGSSTRCGCCGRVFPLLVDDVLCISCDSLLYPAAVAS